MRMRNGFGLVLGAMLVVGVPGAVLPTIAQDAATQKVSITRAQADRGRAEYTRNCVDCHGANLDDGEFGGPPLIGAAFKEKYFGVTADALHGFLSTAMPPDRPGRLSPQVYADITAYILSKNGIQPGTAELPPDINALGLLTVE